MILLDIIAMPEQKEYIICAAIWYHLEDRCNVRAKNTDKGFVLCGRRHADIISTLYQLTGIKTVGNHVQGFLTNTNRFVDRFEGRKIASKAGQAEDSKYQLYSEDLY